MNQKRTFGGLLTVLGIIGIICAALVYLQVANLGITKFNAWVPFVLGLIFFFAGINLIRTTGDRA
ncbi:hypothetical protein LJY25_00620 [Hymenobacter sp. BT175]|uniref:hypothetical protein n=1 Tax=Hymenobacter translucens TaxID=2886507 RepID=UPI001D0E656C|nr:hypothetical protein [Hymenobacter translucens]MCC2544931.1 hypothetical protein [Hymenobacter translucens]